MPRINWKEKIEAAFKKGQQKLKAEKSKTIVVPAVITSPAAQPEAQFDKNYFKKTSVENLHF